PLHEVEVFHIKNLMRKGIADKDEAYLESVIVSALRAIKYGKSFNSSGLSTVGKIEANEIYGNVKDDCDVNTMDFLSSRLRMHGTINSAAAFNNRELKDNGEVSDELIKAWKDCDFERVCDLTSWHVLKTSVNSTDPVDPAELVESVSNTISVNHARPA